MSIENYFIIRSGDGGLSVDGPMTRAAVAERIRPDADGYTYYGRDLRLVDFVPHNDKGCFSDRRLPKNPLLVIRGEVVTADEFTMCACESGRPFALCHGAEVV